MSHQSTQSFQIPQPFIARPIITRRKSISSSFLLPQQPKKLVQFNVLARGTSLSAHANEDTVEHIFNFIEGNRYADIVRNFGLFIFFLLPFTFIGHKIYTKFMEDGVNKRKKSLKEYREIIEEAKRQQANITANITTSNEIDLETSKVKSADIYECEVCQAQLRPATDRAKFVLNNPKFKCPGCGGKGSLFFNIYDVSDSRARQRLDRLEEEKRKKEEAEKEDYEDDEYEEDDDGDYEDEEEEMREEVMRPPIKTPPSSIDTGPFVDLDPPKNPDEEDDEDKYRAYDELPDSVKKSSYP